MMRPGGELPSNPGRPSPTPGYQTPRISTPPSNTGFVPRPAESAATAGARVRAQVRQIVRNAGGKPFDGG